MSSKQTHPKLKKESYDTRPKKKNKKTSLHTQSASDEEASYM